MGRVEIKEVSGVGLGKLGLGGGYGRFGGIRGVGELGSGGLGLGELIGIRGVGVKRVGIKGVG